MNIGNKIRYGVSLVAGLGVLFICDGIYCNNVLQLQRINVSTDKTEESLRIAQISDLHNKEFGADSFRLVRALEEEHPDVIVVTGDVVDFIRTDVDVVIALLKRLSLVSDIYYVTGNHEGGLYGSPKGSRERINFEKLCGGLKDIGVTILDDKVAYLTYHPDFCLIGLNDTSFGCSGLSEIKSYTSDRDLTDSKLKYLGETVQQDKYKILLSHRPELIDVYADNDIDLAITGHAHGGQVRLPIIGGLFSPGQGILPKYTDGLYKVKDVNLVVSRGLGNSRFPFRIYNQAEIVIIDINGGV